MLKGAHILRANRWLSVCLLCFGITRADAADPKNLPLIDSATRYFSMTSAQVREGYPVRIEGVVLYSDSEWRLLWISGTGGTLFHQPPQNLPLPPAGNRAVMTGRTALVKGKQRIVDFRLEDLGPGQMPPPILLTPDMLQAPDRIFKRVMFGGTVVYTAVESDRLALYVTLRRGHQIRVYVQKSDAISRQNLLGAKVEVTGVPTGVPEMPPPGVADLQVFVSDMNGIVVFRRGPTDRFDAPLITIESAPLEFRRMQEPRLVRMRSTLGESPGEGMALLKEGKRQLPVRWIEAPKLPSGTQVEASGFVWKIDDQLVLDRAVVRRAPEGKAEAPEVDELPILQSALAIRGLTTEQASKKYPVDLRGVVTYYDRSWRVLFVHDATGGIYVEKKDRPLPVNLGDRVRVRGVTDPGGFAPMILSTQLDKLDAGELPAAREVSYGRLMSGAEDSQWVTLEGTVHHASRSAKNLRLNMAHAEGPFEAILMDGAKLLNQTNWVGARLRLTGVCGIRPNAHRQPLGLLMHIPSPAQLEFLDAPPIDPFAISITPLERLLQFRVDGESPRQVKVNGVVTYRGDTGLTAIQDASLAILVKFPTNRIPAVGDRIDVLGFPAPGKFSPTLRRPRWQKIENAPLPDPVVVSVPAALSGESASQLVTLEATVVENYSRSAVPSLTLRNRGIVFSADISAVDSDRFDNLAAGSRIRLTGVCNVQADEWNTPRSFTLLVPDESEFEVLEEPPLLTEEHVKFVAGGLAVATLLALLWVRTLRSRVASQTRQISDELEARNRLSDRYNDLVENAADLIFTLSPSGAFTAVNRAAERAFGKTRADLLEQPIAGLLEETSKEKIQAALATLSAQQPEAHLELRLAAPESSILDTAIRLQSHADGATDIQCIARNITRRRQLEEQIRQMQKMESVGQLAAGIAHDYNNLMTIIMGNTDMLLEEANLQGESANLLDEVHGAAARASRLTGQLMTFSRKQIMKASLIDPGEVVGGLRNIIKRTLGEAVIAKFEIPDKLPTILADRGMIEQVLVNLTLNARDAMPEGGELTVAVKKVTVSPEQADAHRDALPGEHVRISVSDTGAGMNSSVLSRIFEPFFTTKEVGKGTGLGLSTVFGIAKQHQGWVEVHSTEGKGSTFHVFFPTTDDSPPTPDAAGAADSDCRGEETILLVEDSDRVRETMTKVLRRAGYHVFEAVNGNTARDQWREHRDIIDLVITDMVMPGGVSGRDLARELRQDDPRLLMVFCSGYSEELTRLSELGAHEQILPKPFENKALLKTVRNVIDSAARN